MGQVTSTAQESEACKAAKQSFARFHIDDVVQVYKRACSVLAFSKARRTSDSAAPAGGTFKSLGGVEVTMSDFFEVFGPGGTLGMGKETLSLPFEVFRLFDKPATGKVAVMELFVVLALYSTGDMKARMKFCFDTFDDDGSGELDRDEMYEVILTATKVLWKLGDLPEVPDEEVMRLVAADMFETADADGSGDIDVEEFYVWASKSTHSADVMKKFNRMTVVAKRLNAKEKTRINWSEVKRASHPYLFETLTKPSRTFTKNPCRIGDAQESYEFSSLGELQDRFKLASEDLKQVVGAVQKAEALPPSVLGKLRSGVTPFRSAVMAVVMSTAKMKAPGAAAGAGGGGGAARGGAAAADELRGWSDHDDNEGLPSLSLADRSGESPAVVPPSRDGGRSSAPTQPPAPLAAALPVAVRSATSPPTSPTAASGDAAVAPPGGVGGASNADAAANDDAGADADGRPEADVNDGGETMAELQRRRMKHLVALLRVRRPTAAVDPLAPDSPVPPPLTVTIEPPPGTTDKQRLARAGSLLGASPYPPNRSGSVDQQEADDLVQHLMIVNDVLPADGSDGTAAAASPAVQRPRSRPASPTRTVSPKARPATSPAHRRSVPPSNTPTAAADGRGFAPLNFDGRALGSPVPAPPSPLLVSPVAVTPAMPRGHGGRFRSELQVLRSKVVDRPRRINSTLSIARALEEDAAAQLSPAGMAAATGPLLTAAATTGAPTTPAAGLSRSHSHSHSHSRSRSRSRSPPRRRPQSASRPSPQRTRQRPRSAAAGARRRRPVPLITSSPTPSPQAPSTPGVQLTPGRIRPASSGARKTRTRVGMVGSPVAAASTPARGGTRPKPRASRARGGVVSPTRGPGAGGGFVSPAPGGGATPSPGKRRGVGLFSPVGVGASPRRRHGVHQTADLGKLLRMHAYGKDGNLPLASTPSGGHTPLRSPLSVAWK